MNFDSDSKFRGLLRAHALRRSREDRYFCSEAVIALSNIDCLCFASRALVIISCACILNLYLIRSLITCCAAPTINRELNFDST
jgi:hypothetical protein